MSEYRWIVTVKVNSLSAPYVREIVTERPAPEQAIQRALDRIVAEAGSSLAERPFWGQLTLTVVVERVR